jgi:hypothetical protein
MRALPNFITQTVPVATPAQLGGDGQRRLMGAFISGQSANTKVEFFDSTDGSGTAVLTVSAPANHYKYINLAPFGGLIFNTALYCTPAGTGAIVYCWFD